MRGKRKTRRTYRQDKRITPADAGKTCSESQTRMGRWDHPRGCGENCPSRGFWGFSLGSPPQVRGKLTVAVLPYSTLGITPAGAGKTPPTAEVPPAARDHPRRCGENPTFVPAVVEVIGSPPQVRGKHVRLITPLCVPRITPAGAGKTCRHLRERAASGDHPRRCGENFTRLSLR